MHMAEFQHVNCMIEQIWEVKGIACYTRAETFTEAVASMVAMPLQHRKNVSVFATLYLVCYSDVF